MIWLGHCKTKYFSVGRVQSTLDTFLLNKQEKSGKETKEELD